MPGEVNQNNARAKYSCEYFAIGQVSNFKGCKFRPSKTYSYKLSDGLSIGPASSYEDNLVSNHACRGKIRRFVAAFRSNDSIYICLSCV